MEEDMQVQVQKIPFFNYSVSQNLLQMCTASAKVCHKSIHTEMQYRFSVNYGTLSNLLHNLIAGLRIRNRVFCLVPNQVFLKSRIRIGFSIKSQIQKLFVESNICFNIH